MQGEHADKMTAAWTRAFLDWMSCILWGAVELGGGSDLNSQMFLQKRNEILQRLRVPSSSCLRFWPLIGLAILMKALRHEEIMFSSSAK